MKSSNCPDFVTTIAWGVVILVLSLLTVAKLAAHRRKQVCTQSVLRGRALYARRQA